MKEKRRVFKKSKKSTVSSVRVEKKLSVSPKKKKQIPGIVYFCVFLFLIDVFSIITFLNMFYERQISAHLLALRLASPTIAPYPQLTQLQELQLSAKAAIIMDASSKTLLYEKESQLRFSMASTTKVMTALVGREYFKPQDVLTVKREGVEGVTIGFILGEHVTFENILYAMLLPSGNDAAYVVADNYPGGEMAFINKMNEKAKSLHLTNTHYGDPAGLNDDENYTTVFDLAYLASVASSQSDLVKIFNTKEYMLQNTIGKQYPVKNLNRLLGMYGVTGMKTGFTEGAGGVLITSSVQQGHIFITVVMKSEDRFGDTEQLLSLVTKNLSYFTPVFSADLTIR